MGTVKKYKIGDMRNGFPVLPPQQRKTILFLSDLHLRHSGLGSQKKEIIYETCHRYNFIDMGYMEGISIGKEYPLQDFSDQLEKETGVQDAKMHLKGFDIYAHGVDNEKQQRLLRYIEELKLDALFHFTDPHSWYWMYEIQHHIRNKIPIIYYNIWDNLPYPKYNQQYYACSDLIMNISKQTQNIVKSVSVNYPREQWQTKYVGHGINTDQFKPLSKRNQEYKQIAQLIERDKYDFLLLFVNKNLERKQTSMLMQAWKWFTKEILTPEQAKKALFLLKTEVNYGAGLPLETIRKHVIHWGPNIKFLQMGLNQNQLNALYNCADALISGSTAEGFGLSTAEGLAAGKPFIAPVVGGLQDQMGFYQQDGTLYMNNPKVPSNCFKHIEKSSPWAIPVWTTGTTYIGSMGTPYIYQPTTSIEAYVWAIKEMYDLGDQKRKEYGLFGREWLHSEQAKLTSKWMAQSMIQHIDQMFKHWKPKDKKRMFAGEPLIYDGITGIYNPIKKEWQ